MNNSIKLNKILFPIMILVLIAAILLYERIGIDYSTYNDNLVYLPQSIIDNKKASDDVDKECIILTDSSDEYAPLFLEYAKNIFDTINIGYDVADVAKDKPDLSKYNTAVSVFSDLNVYGTDIFKLTDWVKNGGKLLFLNPLSPTSSLLVISNWLGIHEGGKEYTETRGLKFLKNFMIGSENFEYDWVDPILTLDVGLSTDTTVYIESDTGTPLLWDKEYGSGKFVINNFPSYQKVTRGMTVAAYSLLYDTFSYPVINASTFFIDDFPAPIPSGYNEYITKFYNRDIASFYTNIWWPDIYALSKKYGLKYTGLVIEQYTDDNKSPFAQYGDLTNFTYFGSMLLNNGGELGYHGYNHQPICFDNFDYKGELDYKTWASETDATAALKELTSFCDYLFSDMDYSVYVPPSNILSDEGKKMLVREFPQIKIFSGIYIKTDYEYEQEFCIDKDGKINLPRILSGTIIDNYGKWLELNELNYHYINSHFIHPDDALDPDRGAEIGWKEMRNSFEEYIEWLYNIAPNIRNLNATDSAKAVQRYDTICLHRKTEGNKYIIDIENFYDEAYIMLRINDGEPAGILNGTIEKLENNIYLLTALSDHIEVNIEK